LGCRGKRGHLDLSKPTGFGRENIVNTSLKQARKKTCRKGGGRKKRGNQKEGKKRGNGRITELGMKKKI